MHWRHKGSHLHNNNASLVSRSAHVLCWQCALALSLSVRGPGRASPAVWLAGFAPLAACLAMTHVAVFRLTPNAAGRPSVTSYAYGLFIRHISFKSHQSASKSTWIIDFLRMSFSPSCLYLWCIYAEFLNSLFLYITAHFYLEWC